MKFPGTLDLPQLELAEVNLITKRLALSFTVIPKYSVLKVFAWPLRVLHTLTLVTLGLFNSLTKIKLSFSTISLRPDRGDFNVQL